jgi:hypothetical protein
LFGKEKVKVEKPDRHQQINGPTEVDNKWRWFQIIETFIQKLNMKMDEVYDMNYISSLNWLSFWYEQRKVEEAKNKTKK